MAATFPYRQDARNFRFQLRHGLYQYTEWIAKVVDGFWTHLGSFPLAFSNGYKTSVVQEKGGLNTSLEASIIYLYNSILYHLLDQEWEMLIYGKWKQIKV